MHAIFKQFRGYEIVTRNEGREIVIKHPGCEDPIYKWPDTYPHGNLADELEDAYLATLKHDRDGCY